MGIWQSSGACRVPALFIRIKMQIQLGKGETNPFMIKAKFGFFHQIAAGNPKRFFIDPAATPDLHTIAGQVQHIDNGGRFGF